MISNTKMKQKILRLRRTNRRLAIEVSARHIHLSQGDLAALFGEGYQLKKLRQLTQPCDFAAEETLTIRVGNREIPNIRIVGPVREKTQVELSVTDAFSLGIKLPLRLSGQIEGSPGLTLIGPRGEIQIPEGAIDDQRHLHCNAEEARLLGIAKKKTVSVLVKGDKSLTFHNVKVRIRNDYKLCLHLDTDEGNAAGIDKTGEGIIVENSF